MEVDKKREFVLTKKVALWIADKIFTVLILLSIPCFLVLAVINSGSGKKTEPAPKVSVKINNLNKKYQKSFDSLRRELNMEDGVDLTQDRSKRVFVINFVGNTMASGVEQLREHITAVLSVATTEDEIVINLHTGGGTVIGYGFASSQLERIKAKKIPLTILIDKIAASGGYMMASVGDKIVAAPFAMVGSIGIVLEFPNFHGLFEKIGIEYQQITAGKNKRSVGQFTKVTKESKEKAEAKIKEVHALFKRHIKKHRPKVNINKISTGEAWYGQEALALNLVDEIMTSDDYLLSKMDSATVYQVYTHVEKTSWDQITDMVSSTSAKIIDHVYDRAVNPEALN